MCCSLLSNPDVRSQRRGLVACLGRLLAQWSASGNERGEFHAAGTVYKNENTNFRCRCQDNWLAASWFQVSKIPVIGVICTEGSVLSTAADIR